MPLPVRDLGRRSDFDLFSISTVLVCQEDGTTLELDSKERRLGFVGEVEQDAVFVVGAEVKL